MIKKILVLFVLTSILATQNQASACPQGTEWISNSVLSSLLQGNPALRVTSENSKIKIKTNGAINLSGNAVIQSTIGGPVTMGGDAVLSAKGRYTLVTRGNKKLIKITRVTADEFTTRMYIEGELASENNYTDMIFASDKTIEYKCLPSGRINLIQKVGGNKRVLKFRKR